MNELTPKQQKKVVTELSVLERELDTVLFRRNDDDEDSLLKTGAEVAGTAGAGLAAGYGVNTLRVKGKSINEMPTAVEKRSLIGADSSSANIGGMQPVQKADGSFSARASTMLPGPTRAEGRFVLPTPGTLEFPTRAGTQKVIPAGFTEQVAGKSKGFLGDLATGSKAFGKEAVTGTGDGLLAMKGFLKKLLKAGA